MKEARKTARGRNADQKDPNQMKGGRYKIGVGRYG